MTMMNTLMRIGIFIAILANFIAMALLIWGAYCVYDTKGTVWNSWVPWHADGVPWFFYLAVVFAFVHAVLGALGTVGFLGMSGLLSR